MLGRDVFSQVSCPALRASLCRTAFRCFARRRRRLDEYDKYDMPMKTKAWLKLQQGQGFWPHHFKDMTPEEVSQTVHVASKLRASSNFWERASLAIADTAPSMSPKQLASTVHALGISNYSDEQLLAALSPVLRRVAGDMKPNDLVIVIQALSRAKMSSPELLRSLTRTVENCEWIDTKGLCIVTDSFTTLRFCSDGFLRKLSSWAADGKAALCDPDEVVTLAHSLSLLQPVSGGVSEDLVYALASRAETAVSTLEPPALILLVAAFSKLRASSPPLVNSLESRIGAELYKFHIASLPLLLDGLVSLYRASADAIVAPSGSRLRLFSQMTGRLTRQLRLLRPQDAGRALQAVAKLGVVDPYLEAAARDIVPSKLATWAAKDLLQLLQSYAGGENRDLFMLSSIRKALLPVSQSEGGEVDPAPLSQLDDLEVCRAVEAFMSLEFLEGILLVTLLVQHQRQRMPPSLDLVFASLVTAALPTHEAWAAAVSALARSEPQASGALTQTLSSEMLELWLSRSNSTAAAADDVLLALVAHPRHLRSRQWLQELMPRLAECSAHLMPLLLETLARQGDEAQAHAVDLAFASKILHGAAEDFPGPVVVAALRVAGERWHKAPASALGMLRDAASLLVSRLDTLAPDLSAKAVVRSMQCLRQMRVDLPLSLVKRLAIVAERLEPGEFLFALRQLALRDIRDSHTASEFSAIATRCMQRFRSSRLSSNRRSWELDALCKNLGLDPFEVEAVDLPDEEEETPKSRVKAHSRP